jgi:signal transduction histidine kinase
MEKRVIYMSETIEDFMNYYTPDREKSWFSVNEAIEKALDIVNLKSDERDIGLRLLLNNEYKTYGLMNEFVQVIVSMLSNINDLIAIKKITDAEVTISLYSDDGYIILTIQDNCGGIDEENISKIFDPYFSTKHKSIGTGLGLHIAKMIIEENMSGILNVKNVFSSNNKIVGAKFTIKIKNEN